MTPLFVISVVLDVMNVADRHTMGTSCMQSACTGVRTSAPTHVGHLPHDTVRVIKVGVRILRVKAIVVDMDLTHSVHRRSHVLWNFWPFPLL